MSRALTSTEQACALIKKEVLATTWECERPSICVIGGRFSILTDHKSLVSLLGNKPLEELSPRIPRFRLGLLGFDFEIIHVSGKKKFFVSDSLSKIER